MNMESETSAQPLAPVDLGGENEDAVAHSLRILSTVYNYNHWIYSMIRDFVGNKVLEVGAGIGNITRFLLYVDQLTCLEPAGEYREYLSKKLADHQNARIVESLIEDCPEEDVPSGSMDTVICLNVLEHIEDDVGALKAMSKALEPGGKVVIVVPALQPIYGEMDKAMGHCRRYSKSQLAARMKDASLKVVHARYFNLPGALAWWWQGKVRGKAKIPESGTLFFDKIVPLVAAVEIIVHPPIGQSLVMIAEKR
jgi:SAM-dependent methyltransferase